MLKIAFNNNYIHPLEENHRFPMIKYELIPEQLIRENTCSDKNFFKKENLMRLSYKEGKPFLLDLLNLKVLVSNKNHELLEDTFQTVLKQSVPIFPIKAENLMKNYNLKEGKFLGSKLDEIEQYWIKNNFKISKEEIKKLIYS